AGRASRGVGRLSPVAEELAVLLLGGATPATHAAKASTRIVVNMSPEPVSNVLVSLTENGLVAGAVWLALAHPLVALGAGLVAVGVSIPLPLWVGARGVRVPPPLRGRPAPHPPHHPGRAALGPPPRPPAPPPH